MKFTIEKIDRGHWKIGDTSIRFTDTFGLSGWYVDRGEPWPLPKPFMTAVEDAMGIDDNFDACQVAARLAVYRQRR